MKFCTRPVSILTGWTGLSPASLAGCFPFMSEQTTQTVAAAVTQYRCDNCGSTDAPDIPMEEIHHLAQRLDVGGVVPAGECGHCGALTYWTDGPYP